MRRKMLNVSDTMVLLAFVTLSLLFTNGSAINSESVIETKQKWTTDKHLSDEFSKDNATAMGVLIPDVPRSPNTVELIKANAPRYCIKTHLRIRCPIAFNATVQIIRARPGLTGYVAVEKKVSGKKRGTFVAGTLEACIPLDDANFSSRASAFYFKIPEQTCSEEESTYLESIIDGVPLVAEYEIDIDIEDITVNSINIKPHLAHPTPNTTELIRTGAPRYCIKIHIQLNCTHPFNAIVRIWRRRSNFAGYWVAESRLGTTSDADKSTFVATAPLEACVPMADANYFFTPFSGGYIRHAESLFYISIPEQTCYSDDDSSYFHTRFMLLYQIGTTEYDFRLKLDRGLEEPIIGPHVDLPTKAEEQVKKLVSAMNKQHNDFVSLMKKHDEELMEKLEEMGPKLAKINKSEELAQ